jgi:hypothetical protein
MLRRSFVRRGYQVPNPDTDPTHQFGPYGWTYNLSQVMDVPRTRNRTAAMPYLGRHVNRYKGLTAIHLNDMHPAFRVALNPYLSKLALNRVLPKTDLADAVADYEKVSAKVGHAPTRYAWLAKVLELAALRRDTDAAMSLWMGAPHKVFVEGSEIPPLTLAKTALYCACVGGKPEWKALFEASMKQKWNTSVHFCTVQWSAALECAGRLGDSAAVSLILDEMVDVQADLERVQEQAYVFAFNAAKEPADYENVKKFLHKLTAAKTTKVFKQYKRMRNNAEMGVGDLNAEKFPENDAMFYHVNWHNRVRHPLEFNPRQLFFDFQPPKVVDSRDRAKMSIEEVIKSRVEKWKDEGYLPDDYVAEDVVDDKESRTKSYLRKELWKKKPAVLEDKRFGYTPE